MPPASHFLLYGLCFQRCALRASTGSTHVDESTTFSAANRTRTHSLLSTNLPKCVSQTTAIIWRHCKCCAFQCNSMHQMAAQLTSPILVTAPSHAILNSSRAYQQQYILRYGYYGPTIPLKWNKWLPLSITKGIKLVTFFPKSITLLHILLQHICYQIGTPSCCHALSF